MLKARIHAPIIAIPVFVLTSSSEERDRKRALELGAKAFLVKPPSPKMIFETLGSYSSDVR